MIILKFRGSEFESIMINLKLFSADMKGKALAHRSIGEFSKSIEHKKIYLKIATDLQDPAEEQRALYLLGQTYQSIAISESTNSKKNFSKAHDYFEKSLNAVKGIPARELDKGEREVMRASLIPLPSNLPLPHH